MATDIEPCPFCRSGHLHITQNGNSFCIVCQSCKSKGPHKSALENAIDQWNRTSRRVLAPEGLTGRIEAGRQRLAVGRH